MGSSAVELITPIVSLVQAAEPTSVLDIGVGFGKWGFLLREYIEVWRDRIKKSEWELRIDGVEIYPATHEVVPPYIYDRIYYEDVRKFVPERAYELVLACDVIEHMPKEDGLALRDRFLDWGEACLMSVPIGVEWLRDSPARNPYEAHLASWEDEDFDPTWQRFFVVNPSGKKIGVFFKGEAFARKKVIQRYPELKRAPCDKTAEKSAKAKLKAIKRSTSYKLACYIARAARPLKWMLGRPKAAAPELRRKAAPKARRKATPEPIGAGVPRMPHPTEAHIPEDRLSRFPFPLRHMARCHPRFELTNLPHEPGRFSVCWDGKPLGKTAALADVHNSRSGDAFLVGTGPSIGEIDFDLLRGKACFGTNGAIAKFKEAGFPPEYYAISTYDFFITRFEMVRDALKCGARCFFPFWGISIVAERAPDLLSRAAVYLTDPANQRYRMPRLTDDLFGLWMNIEPSWVGRAASAKRDDRVGFSKDLALGCFHGENVLYIALQVAYYVGFRRLFLLGMDLNYSGPRPRFYEDEKDTRPTWIDVSYKRSILPCFEIVRGLVKQGELEVYNVCPNSRLPGSVIPKLSPRQMAEMIQAT